MCIARFDIKTDRKQSIKDHCKNVADYSEHFSKLNKLELVSTSRLIGLLHDMGKYSDSFQTYIRKAYEAERNGEKYIPTKRTDHGKYGAIYIWKKLHNAENTAFEILTAEVVAFVICCHHGGLQNMVDIEDEVFNSRMIKRLSNEDEYENVEKLFFEYSDRAEIDELTNEAVEEIKKAKCKMNKSWLRNFGYIIKFLYSILTDADRLDSAQFEAETNLLNEYCLNTLFKNYAKNLEEYIANFKLKNNPTKKEKEIFNLRRQISDECLDFSKNNNGVYCLTVPTGGGKTISGFRFALNHALKENMNRIIYVAPYTTIIEQNASVIRKALQCKDMLFEHHSNIIDDGIDETEQDDVINHRGLLAERWDSPIIFTTMVQFLEGIYGKSSRRLRKFHNMSNSVIIIDEVQSVPIKCIGLFNLAVNFLSKYCHCTVVLCTATQPALDKINNHKIEFSETKQMISNVSEKFEAFSRMDIIDKTHEVMGNDISAVIPLVNDVLKDSKSLLMIFNTKSVTERVYEKVNQHYGKEYKVYCLTTRLCAAHRKKLISEIRENLKDKQKVICVSTQLIEAGVDISFENVIRNLSGLDSIAQAAGRGNRHGERDKGCTYIVNLSEKLDLLPEIRDGAQITIELLHLFNGKKNLLSPELTEQYFKRYFSEGRISKQLVFPYIDKYNKEETICNKLICSSNRHKYTMKSNLFLNYMFSDAENHFYVIDGMKHSLVIPYGEGKDLISELYSNTSIEKKMLILKKLQSFSVNIFDNELRALKDADAIDNCEIDGVSVLKDGFYDDHRGITTEKSLECSMI